MSDPSMQYSVPTIGSLPKGEARNRLIAIVSDPGIATVVVVAIRRDGWQAYIGYPSIEEVRPELQTSGEIQYMCTKCQSTEQVSQLGAKLTADEARKIFPKLDFRDGRF
jgi:hypothetical protein